MDECRRVPLSTVIDGMSPRELDHIADQPIIFLNKMRS
jgi:hypothetical protein